MKSLNTTFKDKKIIPGSKVSISVLVDYISEGYTLVDFLSDYPWIKRENAQKVLDRLKSKEFSAGYAF